MAEPKQPKKLAVLRGGLNIAKRLLDDTEDAASSQRAQAMNEALAKLDSGQKLSKAENVAAGLYHPIGEGKKLRVPFSRMTSTVVDNPNVIMHQGKIITPEQAVKERMGFFPLIGDRAETGKILTHVNDRKAKFQTPLTGGGKYMQANYDPVMANSAGWESGKGKVGTLRNRIADIAEAGYQPVGVFSPGSHVQVDFNTMMPHALLGQFDPTETSKKLIKQFDKEVKTAYPDWVGITSPEAEAQLMDKSNGVLRTAFTKTMGKDDYQTGGFPDVPSVRKAISDPDLHDIELGTLGQNMALFDSTGALVDVPKHPSSYPLSMSAQNLGKLDQPENFADFFTTATERRRLLGSEEAKDYRSFELSQPIQYADDEWLNKLMESRRLRDEAIKKGGYAEGGEVDIEAADKRLAQAIEKRMAQGGSVDIEAADARLADAIAKRMAGGGEVGFKKLEFTEDNSPVQVGLHANKQGENDNAGVMANLDMKGAGRLNVGYNLSGRNGQVQPSTMVNYSNNVDDLGFNANVIRPTDAPNDFMMTNLMASYPVGQGRVSAGMHGNRMDGTHRVTGHSLGYNIELGGGNLNLNVMKPKEGKPMVGAQYVRSFDKGGKVGKLAKGVANVGKRLMADDVLPAAERDANLAKFLEPSKTPMRLYHGTTATEDIQGKEAIRRIKPSKEGALGSGVYLTPKTEFANEYAHPYIPGSTNFASGNVLPVYAQIRNPLIIEGKGDPMIEALTKLGMDEESAVRMVERAYEEKGYIGKQVENRARAAGYDGLMQYRDGELGEVVSYNPNAVKSAIGNQGTYDTSLPDLSKAEGGSVFKTIQWKEPQHFDGGGMAVDLSEPSAGSSREPLMTKKDLEKLYANAKRNAPAVYDWAKQNVKDEAKQLQTAKGVKDFALRTGAQYLGGIPDLVNLGLYGIDALADTNLSSENPWFGSQQYMDAMEKAGILGEHEFPIAETVAGFAAPAGLIRKGIKKGVQMYRGAKKAPETKQRGGLAAMSR
jgi:hypothetical protein